MGYVTTKDGVELFYKDWGPRDAQVIYFHIAAGLVDPLRLREGT